MIFLDFYQKIVLLILILTVMVAPVYGTQKQQGRKNLLTYLNQPLWLPRDAYDAGHLIMVPLHWAFYNNDQELKRAFAEHYRALVIAERAGELSNIGRLASLQYLYTASRFISLATEHHFSIPDELIDVVAQKVEHFWQQEPAWQWGREPFRGGIRERLAWKLAHEPPPKHPYYVGIIDEEMFAIAIALDLSHCIAEYGKTFAIGEEAKDYFRRIMTERVQWNGAGWLFQPDIWNKRPEQAYAGYYLPPKANKTNLPPRPVDCPGMDSSHSHRLPLWLLSGRQAMDVSRLQKGLTWQFFNRVLVPSQQFSVPLLNNYTSGHNGFYRWRYQTHKESGYGPYKLSGTFNLGWWSFLGGIPMQELYSKLTQAYPLPPNIRQIYERITTRERNPYVRYFYDNGIGKIIAEMAADISGSIGVGNE